jgi:hypothetical protein
VPRRQTPHPHPKGRQESRQEAPPPSPSGCFVCFGGGSKKAPKSPKESKQQHKVADPSPRPSTEEKSTATAAKNNGNMSKKNPLETQSQRKPPGGDSNEIKGAATPTPAVVSRSSPPRAAKQAVVAVHSSEPDAEARIRVGAARPSPRDREGPGTPGRAGKRQSSGGSDSPLINKHESEVDSYTSASATAAAAAAIPSTGNSNVLPSADVNANTKRASIRSLGRGSGSAVEVHGPSLAVAPSNNNNSSSSSGFAESNKMYDACGIRFDRSQFSGAGDSVANFGDLHSYL